jgi:lysophospholipase L1-like esterase
MSDSSKKPRGRLKRLAQNLALSCVSFFIFLVLCEVALRIAGFGNLEIYQADPLLFWRLKPNQDCYTKVDRKPVHINAKGIRGPEFETQKSANTIRILSLGDSTTFGWGLSDEETYSRRLEALINEKMKGKTRVEVLNGGVNAWSFPQMKNFLFSEAVGWKPDVVILANANAWTQFREDVSPEFRKAFATRVRLKNFLRRFALYHFVIEVQLQGFYNKYRTKFIPVDANAKTGAGDPQADFMKLNAQVFREICDDSKTNGYKALMLCIPPDTAEYREGFAKIVAAKKSAAEASGQWFLDVEPLLNAVKEPVYLEADPIHLNPRGNDIVGRALADFLADRLLQ